jgi:AAA domain
MGILNITEARREGARLLVFLAGVSGGGKTYTALQLAYGLAKGVGKKVGFLDTESGRGRLYADEMPAPFLYAELQPPFSPARYIQSIEEFAAAGVEVLVIDSGSHEFEGIGGIQDIAEAGNPRMPNWNKAKAEHKRFMSAMLASPMHIILCLRAREKAKPEKGQDGKVVYQDMGLQPITEKNVMFEATVSLMLHDQGTRQDVIKCPAAVADIMGRGTGYLSMEDGLALRAWVDGAQRLDPKVEHSRGLLKLAAEKGTEALKEAWLVLPKAHQKAIGGKAGCPADLKASAEAFDRLTAEAASGGAPDDSTGALGVLNAAAASLAPVPTAPQTPTAPAPQRQPAPAPAAQAPAPAADDGEVF